MAHCAAAAGRGGLRARRHGVLAVAVSRAAVVRTIAKAKEALGWDYPDGDLTVSATTVWGLIEGHTRGRGCPVDLAPTSLTPTAAELAAIRGAATPPADLAAVAVTATLRLAPNPAQRTAEQTTSEGGAMRRVEGSFAGWTLAERAVLDRYRRRVR